MANAKRIGMKPGQPNKQLVGTSWDAAAESLWLLGATSACIGFQDSKQMNPAIQCSLSNDTSSPCNPGCRQDSVTFCCWGFALSIDGLWSISCIEEWGFTEVAWSLWPCRLEGCRLAQALMFHRCLANGFCSTGLWDVNFENPQNIVSGNVLHYFPIRVPGSLQVSCHLRFAAICFPDSKNKTNDEPRWAAK